MRLEAEGLMGLPRKGSRAITVDDYFTQADLFSVAYSPRFIAYSEGRWRESSDDRKTDI